MTSPNLLRSHILFRQTKQMIAKINFQILLLQNKQVPNFKIDFRIIVQFLKFTLIIVKILALILILDLY